MKKLCFLIVIIFLVGAGAGTGADGEPGSCVIMQPHTPTKDIKLSNTAALLAVHGPIGWLHTDNAEHISVTLSTHIEQGKDFFVWASPHRFPSQAFATLFLQLHPGKLWAPDLTLYSTEGLFLNTVMIRDPDSNRTIASSCFPPVRIATVFHKTPSCPPPLILPGASAKLQQLVSKVLYECQDPTIVRAESLAWRKYSSHKLLLMRPAMMIVNGSAMTVRGAAARVDSFLAAHSVLSIAWEPSCDEEPRHWVLLPHPPGMPGHLFALLDQLQWRHPSIRHDLNLLQRYPPRTHTRSEGATTINNNIKSKSNSNNRKKFKEKHFCDQSQERYRSERKSSFSSGDEYTCPLGCPGAKLVGITASGYGADAYNVYSRLRDGLLFDTPVQAFPTLLGPHSTPPMWEGQHGWTYTFGGCESDFLDCFFLDHSPCPPVVLDVRALNRSELDLFSFNSSRLLLADGGKVGFELKGDANTWERLVGEGSALVPRRSIRDLWPDALPSRHVFYSYFFRPKYSLRRAVYERLSKFTENTRQLPGGRHPSCATLHVRRGDILFHPNGARYYLPLQAYLRAARIYLNIFNIRTVLLFTDSRRVIEEAHRCAIDFPALCGDISFRYVEKERWSGGEGGWENPFPSGSSTGELLDLTAELALAQQCDLAITGESEFGELLYQHMCCGFPVRQRGSVPQRCLCPPRVKLLQAGFTCEKGNALLCGSDAELESVMTRDQDRKGEKFSSSPEAFKHSTTVQVQPMIGGETKSFLLEKVDEPEVRSFLEEAARQSKQILCQEYDSAPDRAAVCG